MGRQAGVYGPIEHGTNAGYQAHVRQMVPACRGCLDAHNDATRLSRVRVGDADRDRREAVMWAVSVLRKRHLIEFDQIVAARYRHNQAVRLQRNNAKTPASGIDGPGAGVIT